MTSDNRKPRVALPETRQLDLLASMLERREVEVLRCPMIAINDSPDEAAVNAWLERFCDQGFDLLVIYTGEGIRRLRGFAERGGCDEQFVAALGTTPLLTRGPKPARELRALKIKPEYPAQAPTTEGILGTLADLEIEGRTVGVQIYGSEPPPGLFDYLESRGARVDAVAPYVYASESDNAAVGGLIAELEAGKVDAIAFTSKAQVERLLAVAHKSGSGEALRSALEATLVAAIGPIAAAELAAAGIRVDVVPESDFFMKPMVSALMARLGS